MKIPLFTPHVGEEEINAVTEVLRSKWWGLGPKTQEFENRFASYIGSKYAIALNSATAGLHLSLKVLNITSGEILVPAITFISTALAADYNNCTPVFVDVNEDTLTMDIEDLKRKITKKSKAIIPVHYGGHPCDMDEINQIAKEHNLFVIEDAAHASGAEYKGKKVGSLADMAVFSFHPVKNLATGDGGMITTNDEEVNKRLRKLRWCGINKDTFTREGKSYSWYYEIDELGYKFHMNDINAAIGLAQLAKLDNFNNRRREIFEKYNTELKNIVQTPIEKEHIKSAIHNYAIKVPEEKRDALMDFLAQKGISTGVHYFPLHLHPIYKHIKADVPVSDRIWKKIVLLPMFPDLTKEQIEYIISSVKEFFEK